MFKWVVGLGSWVVAQALKMTSCVSQVGNSSMPDLVDVNSPSSSADNIYVTMVS